jgi:hypothetical protein
MSAETIYHQHHIIPRHMGGTDDPTNLVKLTIEEHAEAHRKLYEEYGCWQDKVAWKALAGQITHAEANYEAARRGADNGRAHLKGKTYEEAYGKERAALRKQAVIDGNKARKGIKYKKYKRTDENNPNLIRITCLGCLKETSITAFGKHIKKCF